MLSFAFASNAFAYVDPSVMTYTIQALAGVAVALSAVVGVAFRRGRKVLMKVLDIDESARKEYEGSVRRVGASGRAAKYTHDTNLATSVRGVAVDDVGKSAKPVKPVKPVKNRSKYRPTWRERLVCGLIVAFFFVFTIYFVAPLEIVAGSQADLVYSPTEVWWLLLLPDLGIIAGITLVFLLLRGRAFGVALTVVFAVGLAAYVQVLFMNVGLPAADGSSIVWDDYLNMQVVSTIVWFAILAVALVYCVFHWRRMQGLVVVLAVCLVVVQGVGLAGAIVTSGANLDTGHAKVVMTEDQMFTVSPKHNVVVFVLDTYDTAYLSRVLDANPDLLDGLTGFTNYENATSAMIPTRFAVPAMLTGEMPSYDEPFSTYVDERYSRGTFLSDLSDANYSIGLYTDSLRISRLSDEGQYSITSKTVNMHPLSSSIMDYGGTLYSLYQMGQYRDAPWVAKWAFWYYTDGINRSCVVADDDTDPEDSIYVMDDIRYYNRLRNIGLSLEDADDGYDGAFRFIHLQGSHYPFTYDEDVNDLGEDNSNVFKQSQGAIHIVTEYIDQLKELGVYENTTIIITADHGYWTITLDPIKETSTPIMFVKPEQSAEADAQPIVVDEKPVSHLDLQATVLDAMGLDYGKYTDRGIWSGYSMLGGIPADRERYYLTTDSEPDLTETQFREYLISGNSLDWANWHLTGRTINAQE